MKNAFEAAENRYFLFVMNSEIILVSRLRRGVFPRSAHETKVAGSFYVLIDENGTGKTTILDALAVALSVWLDKAPDSHLANSRRRLTADQQRLVSQTAGDLPNAGKV